MGDISVGADRGDANGLLVSIFSFFSLSAESGNIPRRNKSIKTSELTYIVVQVGIKGNSWYFPLNFEQHLKLLLADILIQYINNLLFFVNIRLEFAFTKRYQVFDLKKVEYFLH